VCKKTPWGHGRIHADDKEGGTRKKGGRHRGLGRTHCLRSRRFSDSETLKKLGKKIRRNHDELGAAGQVSSQDSYPGQNCMGGT